MVYAGIFAVGIAVGMGMVAWLFTYLINRCDIYISPDPYIRKKILKKRALATGVHDGQNEQDKKETYKKGEKQNE